VSEFECVCEKRINNVAEKTKPILHRKGHKYQDNGKDLVLLQEQEVTEDQQVFCVDKKRLLFLKHTNPVAFRELAEQTMIELVKYMILKNAGKPVEFFDVQRSASFKIGVSMETVKRYMFTHSAEEAELRLTGKKVSLNPSFKPAEEESEDE
jgi:hypothetical protein